MRLVCFCRRPQLRLLNLASVNIHTHLIPFVAWLVALFPFSPFSSTASEHDTPMLAFTAFALLCLFTSALWHTMAGCAHPKGMELCARIDYVGIGWYVCISCPVFLVAQPGCRLISASVGTVVHYGFQCDTLAHDGFLSLCLVMGILDELPGELSTLKTLRIWMLSVTAIRGTAIGYLGSLTNEQLKSICAWGLKNFAIELPGVGMYGTLIFHCRPIISAVLSNCPSL